MPSQQSSRDSWDGDGVDLTVTGSGVFCVSPHGLGLSQPSTSCSRRYRAGVRFLGFGEFSSCSVMNLPEQ